MSARHRSRGRGPGKWLVVVAIAVLLGVVAFEVGRRWRVGGGSGRPPTAIEDVAVLSGPDAPAAEDQSRRRGAAPRVALVIDDLGRSLEDLARLRGLGVALTYSVLPFESRTAEVVDELRRAGEEILCHLPMEARSGANPGPGALTFAMTAEELGQRTSAALDAVPGAVGANNHMGSRLSADRGKMKSVLEILAARQLYFLDSRTTAETIGFELARELGLAAAERQVFLDRERDRGAIERQFERLLERAGEEGSAIAIGHPYEETLEVLEERIPAALERGFVFVTASQLLEGG